MDITVAGVSTHVVVEGSGQPLLMLHGNPDSHQLWRPLMNALQGQYRFIAPDLPGFGRSQARTDGRDVTLQGMAEWVEEVLDQLQIREPVNLMVHDFGGVYGLAFLAAKPHRVRRLVVTNTLFHEDYLWHFWARIWRSRVLGEVSMALLGLPVIGRFLFNLSMRIGGPKLPQAQIDDAYACFGPSVRQQVLRLYRETDPEKFAGWESRMLANAARIPTLVLWGRRDPFIDEPFASRFATTDIHVFPAAGHWLAVEEVEAIAPLIDRHLQGPQSA